MKIYSEGEEIWNGSMDIFVKMKLTNYEKHYRFVDKVYWKKGDFYIIYLTPNGYKKDCFEIRDIKSLKYRCSGDFKLKKLKLPLIYNGKLNKIWKRLIWK